MKKCVFTLLIVFLSTQVALGAGGRISKDSNACIECHASVHPGIVAAWEKSRLAKVTPMAAKSMIQKKRRVSFWEKGAAKGLAQKDSIFNEAIEKKWVEQWLFYANSTRYASAMVGAADYGAFANGRWYMSRNIQEMVDWLEFKLNKK